MINAGISVSAVRCQVEDIISQIEAKKMTLQDIELKRFTYVQCWVDSLTGGVEEHEFIVSSWLKPRARELALNYIRINGWKLSAGCGFRGLGYSLYPRLQLNKARMLFEAGNFI